MALQPIDAAPSASPVRSSLPAESSLPTTGFLRQPQVLRLVPVSKSTLWRRVGEGMFPTPVKLSSRVTAWRVEDVRDWIEAQAGQRSRPPNGVTASSTLSGAGPSGPRQRAIRRPSRAA